MISYEEFEEIVVNVLERDISSNEDQKQAISSSSNQSLFIVAGPGSGKTTVMVLKILKFIFVDDRKAASELLSRILSWGDKIRSKIIANYMDKMFSGEITDDSIIREIQRIDFNQMQIGTIDSVAEEILRVHRKAGTSQPIIIEDFVANSVMINECLLKDNRYKNEALQEYLAEVSGKESNTQQKPKIKNLTMMAETLIKIKEHIYYNMVDINDILRDVSPSDLGKQLALKLIVEYVERLQSQNIYDFAMLETEFLNRLNSDSLDVFLNEIKII